MIHHIFHLNGCRTIQKPLWTFAYKMYPLPKCRGLAHGIYIDNEHATQRVRVLHISRIDCCNYLTNWLPAKIENHKRKIPVLVLWQSPLNVTCHACEPRCHAHEHGAVRGSCEKSYYGQYIAFRAALPSIHCISLLSIAICSYVDATLFQIPLLLVARLPLLPDLLSTLFR